MRKYIGCYLSVVTFLLLAHSLFGQTEKASSLYYGQELDTQEIVSSIAFGSCNHQARENEQHIWVDIAKSRPDLWVWMGDIVYGDTENMRLLESRYNKAKTNRYYAAFRQICPIIGVWDDHDYGVNDGDRTYSMKEESKQLMLDFLDVPLDAEVRKRKGVYQSMIFGEGEKTVKIIMLDTRTFRGVLEPDPSGQSRYLPNHNGDMLGEAQWKWLENELTNSTARINIIVSSVQLIAEQQKYEKWANFPTARRRMFDLIAESDVMNPIVLSGDRHMAEVAAIKVPGIEETLYEITSSGLTHTWSDKTATEENRYRVGPLMVNRNFGLLKIYWNDEPLRVILEIYGPGERGIMHTDVIHLK